MANGQEKQRVSPAEMQKYLKGVNYPAAKDELIKAAEGESAPAEIVEKIKQLTSETYNSSQDVMKELGKSM